MKNNSEEGRIIFEKTDEFNSIALKKDNGVQLNCAWIYFKKIEEQRIESKEKTPKRHENNSSQRKCNSHGDTPSIKRKQKKVHGRAEPDDGRKREAGEAEAGR